mmetsp:Transcript_6591/g.27136  ORF Transcript_6591/g.27136 Transcript_6591/m.27136 type:complete len:206 (-) Transcript_6591:568-1185(-)
MPGGGSRGCLQQRRPGGPRSAAVGAQPAPASRGAAPLCRARRRVSARAQAALAAPRPADWPRRSRGEHWPPARRAGGRRRGRARRCRSSRQADCRCCRGRRAWGSERHRLGDRRRHHGRRRRWSRWHGRGLGLPGAGALPMAVSPGFAGVRHRVLLRVAAQRERGVGSAAHQRGRHCRRRVLWPPGAALAVRVRQGADEGGQSQA